MYDNPHMDSYLSDEQDGEHGGGLGSIHAFGGMGMGDEMDNDEKALLGGPAKRKVGCHDASCRHSSPGTTAGNSDVLEHDHIADRCCLTKHVQTAFACWRLWAVGCDRGKHVQGGYAKSVESFGYATEMNPKLKGKKTPLLPAEPTEEYIPPAFNASEVIPGPQQDLSRAAPFAHATAQAVMCK